MLSCREVARLASERLDRPLTWRERMAFRFHLMMCRTCTRYARQLAWMRDATAHLRQQRFEKDVEQEAPVLPDASRERIARRLREASDSH